MFIDKGTFSWLVVKWILRGLFVLICLADHQATFAQSELPVTIDVGDSDDLRKIAEKFSERGNYFIAYPSYLADIRPTDTGTISATSLALLLEKMFIGQIEVIQSKGYHILIRGKTQPQIPDIFSADIFDEANNPIPDVLVYSNQGKSVFSDENGHFDMPYEPGIDDTLYFEAFGYKSTQRLVEDLKVPQTVTLQSDPIFLLPITVTEPVPVLKMDSHLSHAQNIRSSSFMSAISSSDILKKIQLLPGVAAHDDRSAQLKIRGSEGHESLLILDGIPLHHVDHFYGIFGAVNGYYVRKSTLYKNAGPVKYGGKTGGLLVMQSQKEASEFQGSIEADFLQSSLYATLPISKKISIFLGARTTYRNASKLSLAEGTNQNAEFFRESEFPVSPRIQSQPSYYFNDVNGKIKFDLGNKADMDLNWFSSNDQYENNYGIRFPTAFSQEKTENRGVIEDGENWSSRGSSLNIAYNLDSLTRFKTNVYYSSYDNQGSSKSLIERAQLGQSMTFSNLQQNSIKSTGGHIYFEKETDSHLSQVGIDVVRHNTSFSFSEDQSNLLEDSSAAHLITVFAEKNWNRNHFELNVGARSSFYSNTRKVYLDPKIQFSFGDSQKFKWKNSIHLTHQYSREFNFENRQGKYADYIVLSDDGRYPVGQSFQIMTGFTIKKISWSIDVEAYRKLLTNTIEFVQRLPGINQNAIINQNRSYQIFSGEGRVHGIDFLFEKRFKNVQTWIAYTLSKSARKYKEIRRGRPFPAQDDRRHQLKWTNEWTKNRVSVGANFILSSGKPYLALNELSGGQDRNQFERRAFIEYLPAYWRIDLGIKYRFKLSSFKGTIGLSVFNVSDRDNVKYLQYIFSVPLQDGLLNSVIGTETTLLGRTPNLSLRFDF